MRRHLVQTNTNIVSVLFNPYKPSDELTGLRDYHSCFAFDRPGKQLYMILRTTDLSNSMFRLIPMMPCSNATHLFIFSVVEMDQVQPILIVSREQLARFIVLTIDNLVNVPIDFTMIA